MRLTPKKFILLTILLFALLLRISGLGKESIWLDEAVSIRSVQLSAFPSDLTQMTEFPLYHMLLHYWIKVFSDSEFSVRFLSLVFGLTAVFMLYKLGSLIFDEETGILASLLVALSAFHIQYAQEARNYTLFALLTLFSFYFFIKLIKNWSIKSAIGYIVSSILLVSTHPYALFMLATQNVYIFTLPLLSKNVEGLSFKKWFICQLVLLIFFLPFIGIFIGKISTLRNFPLWWMHKPGLFNLSETFFEYCGSVNLRTLFFPLAVFSLLSYRKLNTAVNVKSIFGAIANARYAIRVENINSIYLLVLWLFFPIISAYIISMLILPVYNPRYTIGCSLAFYLLVAKGIRNINYNRLRRIIVAIIIVFSLTSISDYLQRHKQNWREIAAYIDRNANFQDLMVFRPGTGKIPFNYYSKRKDLIKDNFLDMYEPMDESNIKKLKSIIEGRDRLWLILYSEHGDKKSIEQYFLKRFHLVYFRRYGYGSRIYVYLFVRGQAYNILRP